MAAAFLVELYASTHKDLAPDTGQVKRDACDLDELVPLGLLFVVRG